MPIPVVIPNIVLTCPSYHQCPFVAVPSPNSSLKAIDTMLNRMHTYLGAKQTCIRLDCLTHNDQEQWL